VPEAARALGISERAVRKRVSARTLAAIRDGHAWVVFLPQPLSSEPGSEPTEREGERAAPSEPTGTVSAAQMAVPTGTSSGGIDLSPLVQHIERKDEEIRRLTEAAFLWQARAMQLEERVKALEAGPIPAQPGSDPEAHVQPPPEPEEAPPPTEISLGLAWRRWFRRLLGQP
jgi:hypothetical protein